MEVKNIYNLKLHEWAKLDSNGNMLAYRVPGGWIYQEPYQNFCVFVPFSYEFKEDSDA